MLLQSFNVERTSNCLNCFTYDYYLASPLLLLLLSSLYSIFQNCLNGMNWYLNITKYDFSRYTRGLLYSD
jgi:hypothetical protein